MFDISPVIVYTPLVNTSSGTVSFADSSASVDGTDTFISLSVTLRSIYCGAVFGINTLCHVAPPSNENTGETLYVPFCVILEPYTVREEYP